MREGQRSLSIPTGDQKQLIRQNLADFIISQGHEATDEDIIRDYLFGCGHSEEMVDSTCEWLEMVIRSGKATETLDLIQQTMVAGVRVENPFDRPYLSDKLWKKIESWRLRGILPADVVERLLVGLRNVDVRDWEEEDVKDLVANLLAPAFNDPEIEDLKVYENCITESFYC